MDELTKILGQLGIDDTFLYLFGLVWVFYFVFSSVYLKPFQKLLRRRHEKTLGSKKEAQDLLVKAEEKLTQYKARLKEVNEKARGVLLAGEEYARKEETKLLGEATNKAKTSLQGIQIELEKQRKEVVGALSGDINTIAAEIATKAMGRTVSLR